MSICRHLTNEEEEEETKEEEKKEEEGRKRRDTVQRELHSWTGSRQQEEESEE